MKTLFQALGIVAVATLGSVGAAQAEVLGREHHHVGAVAMAIPSIALITAAVLGLAALLVLALDELVG